MIRRTLITACVLAALTGFAVAQGTSGGTTGGPAASGSGTGGSAAGGAGGTGGGTAGAGGTGTSGATAGAGGGGTSGGQGGSTFEQTVPGWGGTQARGAQAGQPAQPGQAGQAGQPGPGGLIALNPRTVVLTYYTAQPVDVLASKLMNMTVYNQDGQKVGSIEDLLIDQGRNIAGVVIGVGGFLGIGERYISLPPSSIVLAPQGDRSYRAIINTTREDIHKAPEFKFEGAQSR